MCLIPKRKRAEAMFQRTLHLYGAMGLEVISHSCPTKPQGTSITEEYPFQKVLIDS